MKEKYGKKRLNKKEEQQIEKVKSDCFECSKSPCYLHHLKNSENANIEDCSQFEQLREIFEINFGVEKNKNEK